VSSALKWCETRDNRRIAAGVSLLNCCSTLSSLAILRRTSTPPQRQLVQRVPMSEQHRALPWAWLATVVYNTGSTDSRVSRGVVA
jgi:hypothetical protein